jgi:hypothetical protein
LQRILINISSEFVLIKTDWEALADVFKKDFWSFLSKESIDEAQPGVVISVFQTADWPTIPETVSSMQTQNAITYDLGSKRFCDYYNKAYTSIDFETNQAQVYGVDFDFIHEITYLLILSRIGKKLDLKGIHKLHAFAISFEDLAFVCMMPSKGGKSTLLAELLKDSRIKMISDDIPLVDSFGCIHPFALKLGMNDVPDGLEIVEPDQNIYSMKRNLYGEKVLICTRGLRGKVEDQNRVFSRVILAEAFRYNSEFSQIHSSSWGKTIKGLFKHGILGLGSPLIIEYFWQSGLKDFLIKTRIFILRCIAFGSLSFRAKKVTIYLGKNPKHAAKEIMSYLEKTV